MKQVVYIDEIFLVNLVMNLTALWLTSRFSGMRVSPMRMITGAAVGCIYALSIFIPGWQMLVHPGLKLLVAGLMLLISFGPSSLKEFGRKMAYLLLASFALGGMAVGIDFLLANTLVIGLNEQLVVGGVNRWVSLASTITIAYVIGKWGSALWLKRLQQAPIRVPLKVNLWGKEVSVLALIDTGNQLTEPLSQRPVIIMEFNALQPALPSKINEIFHRAGKVDGAQAMLAMANTPYASRLRLIPFKSLGQEKGTLLGICPDEVDIQYGGQNHTYKDIVVGIYNHQLSPESAYKALLHPQLLAS